MEDMDFFSIVEYIEKTKNQVYRSLDWAEEAKKKIRKI